MKNNPEKYNMKRNNSQKKRLLGAFIGSLAIWYMLSLLVNEPMLPSPFEVIRKLALDFSGLIAVHFFYSLKRILQGLFFSVVLGVPIGIIMGYFKPVGKTLSPFLYFAYPVPKLALLPIVMLFFGIGETSKVVMIFLITFFPVVLNIRDKVQSIPEEVYHILESVGASHTQIIKEIVLPGILPVILTSTRIGIGTAISVLFFAENFGTKYGVGYYIMDSWMRVRYVEMYGGILILSLLGLGIFRLIDLIEEKACPWKD